MTIRIGLSEPTRLALERVSACRQSWRSRFGTSALVQAIEAVADTDDPLAVSSLLDLAFDDRTSVAAAAREAIGRLLGIVSPIDLPVVDESARSRGAWSISRGPRPDAVRDLVPTSVEDVLVLGVASFGANGFVREAAVERLAESSIGGEVGFLLLRANDWVEPIRTRAKRALLERVDRRDVDAFIRALPLVARLRECLRADHAELLAAIEGLLAAGDGAALRDVLLLEDRFARRYGVDIALRRGLVPILEAALGDDDIVVHTRVVRGLLNPARPGGIELAERLVADAVPAVRLLALRFVVEHGAERPRQRLLNALFDRSGGVRLFAAYVLRRRFDVDVADVYRTECPRRRGEALVACLAGLRSHGEAGDATALRELARGGSSRVRRAALRAIAALDFESHGDLFIEALEDDLLSVSRVAGDALVRHRAFAVDAVRALVWTSPREHARIRAFRALDATLDKWARLLLILDVAGSGDPVLSPHARSAVERWGSDFNRSYKLPTADERAQIAARLDDPTLGWPERLVDSLREALPR